jgi:uncharacterized protein with gpF-like domain
MVPRRRIRLPLRTLQPAIPNAGVEEAYFRKLDALITRMMARVKKAVAEDYASVAATFAQDAMPSFDDEFYEEAERIAWGFAQNAGKHTRATLIIALEKAGYTPSRLRSLRRRPEQLNSVIHSIITENVALIRSIPDQTRTRIWKLVAESLERQRDLGTLVKELEKIEGITRRRARTIARDQNNKITESVSLVRTQALGITEGLWMHRGGAKIPRASHVQMDGERFNLAEGLYDPDEGRNVMPGELINCHCTYRPILPDLE